MRYKKSSERVLNLEAARRERAQDKVSHWHRRHAIQLAAQLPDEQGDALIVLNCVRELLDGYLYEDAIKD